MSRDGLLELLDPEPRLAPPPVAAVAAPPRRWGVRALDVARAYLMLTKPRIVELLLVTTVPTMLLADRGVPAWWLIAVVVVGGAFAAGSANALNCYIDRDIDQIMTRTASRPLPRHVVSPQAALIFGLIVGTGSVGLLWATTNALAGLLTLGAIAYYVVVYTLLLKRRTSANTVLGGACGAAPVLIGWAAVTGGLSLTAWALFAVVFFWQPPHFFALAIKYKDDYASVGVPMLPVVATLRRVAIESLVYGYLTVAASLFTWWVADRGPLFGVTAVVCGVVFMVEIHRMERRIARGVEVAPMRVFHWSITYLTLLFALLAVDVLIAG